MHIAIDGKPLAMDVPCGLSRYAENLIGALSRLQTRHAISVLTPKRIGIPESGSLKEVPLPSTLPWQIRFPRAISAGNYDAVHILQQHGSLFLFHPRILMTVHDLSPAMAYPSFADDWRYSLLGAYTRFVMRLTIPRSANHITDSQFTRTELTRAFRLKERPTVVYAGIGLPFAPGEGRGSYILAFADFSPRKNIGTALRAYGLLSPRLRSRFTFHVVVSMPGAVSPLVSLAKSLGIEDRLVIHESPSDRDLVSIYRHAAVLVYPSKYEGFGLPVLEAMACGVPVVCSRSSSIPEVAGNSALYADPDSPKSVAAGLARVCSDQRLARRLRVMGLEQASRFSWRHAARDVLSVYDRL